jgi:hypothetical protein
VIAQMAEQVVVMYAGRIVEQGATAELLLHLSSGQQFTRGAEYLFIGSRALLSRGGSPRLPHTVECPAQLFQLLPDRQHAPVSRLPACCVQPFDGGPRIAKRK